MVTHSMETHPQHPCSVPNMLNLADGLYLFREHSDSLSNVQNCRQIRLTGAVKAFRKKKLSNKKKPLC